MRVYIKQKVLLFMGFSNGFGIVEWKDPSRYKTNFKGMDDSYS